MDGLLRRLEEGLNAAWALVLAILFWPVILFFNKPIPMAIAEVLWLSFCIWVFISLRRRRNKRNSQFTQQTHFPVS